MIALFVTAVLAGIVGIHIGVGPNPVFNFRDRIIVSVIGGLAGFIIGALMLIVARIGGII